MLSYAGWCYRIPEFVVVLVEPKYGGNIGAVARVMMNFDIDTLYLVNPCKLDDDCYARSMHASSLLDTARIFPSFQDATKDLDFLVATSSIDTESERKHLRNPVFLPEFAKQIFDVDGRVGLLFGREDYGLLNKEIAKCDLMVKIPTSDRYHSMNLSHAVCIILYELFVNKYKPLEIILADGKEKEKLYEFFDKLLDAIEYPEFKKENARILFRRVIGRAMLSKWEYHTLMGIFKKAIEKSRKSK